MRRILPVLALAIATLLTVSVTAQPSAVYIAFEGDSITDPNTGRIVGTQMYPYLSATHFVTPITYTIFATNGAQISNLVSRESTVNASFVAGKTNILSVFAGTNDLALGGRTPAQVIADTKSYCLAMKAVHPWKIVVYAMLPRDNFGTTQAAFNPLRAAVLAGFLADPSFYDYIVRFDQDPLIGCDTCVASNPTYYIDRCHPTYAGNQVMTPYVVQMTSYLAPRFPMPMPFMK